MRKKPYFVLGLLTITILLMSVYADNLEPQPSPIEEPVKDKVMTGIKCVKDFLTPPQKQEGYDVPEGWPQPLPRKEVTTKDGLSYTEMSLRYADDAVFPPVSKLVADNTADIVEYSNDLMEQFNKMAAQRRWYHQQLNIALDLLEKKQDSVDITSYKEPEYIPFVIDPNHIKDERGLFSVVNGILDKLYDSVIELQRGDSEIRDCKRRLEKIKRGDYFPIAAYSDNADSPPVSEYVLQEFISEWVKCANKQFEYTHKLKEQYRRCQQQLQRALDLLEKKRPLDTGIRRMPEYTPFVIDPNHVKNESGLQIILNKTADEAYRFSVETEEGQGRIEYYQKRLEQITAEPVPAEKVLP